MVHCLRYSEEMKCLCMQEIGQFMKGKQLIIENKLFWGSSGTSRVPRSSCFSQNKEIIQYGKMDGDRCKGISWEMGLRDDDVPQGIELFIPFHCPLCALNSCCLFYGTSVCQGHIEVPLLGEREYMARKIVGSEDWEGRSLKMNCSRLGVLRTYQLL